MHTIHYLLHYATIALSVGLTGLGVGIGQGIANQKALEALNTQPSAQSEISKLSFLGIALIETAAIISIVISMILLFGTNISSLTYNASLAELGIACAIALPGIVVGIMSAFPVSAACMAVARQPFFSQKILTIMLIALSIIQTPIIFGFLVAMLINAQLTSIVTHADSVRLIASGLAIGLGSLGPVIGLGIFAHTACTSIGINRNAYNKIVSFTFISQALIETPVIFSLVVSLIIAFATITHDNSLSGILFLAAALCTGLGTLGAGISSGRTAAAACKQIAYNPELSSTLSRVSMLAQGMIDTSAIYALLISMILVFL